MLEFFIGMIVFAGIVIGIGSMLYIVGKLALILFDIKDETNTVILLIGGVLVLALVSGIISLCYTFYLLGTEILN